MTSLSIYDFYTTLPHNLIEDILIDLIERTFQREGSFTLHVTTEMRFSLQNSREISCMVLSKCM